MDFPQKFNVLVCGTPGCGKTSLCQMLQDELGLAHIEVGKVIKEEKFFTEFDPAFDSYIIEQDDEDRLLDYLEPVLVRGGVCVDYHGSDFFPRRWFGMVLVLRTETEKIFDRLTARGYGDAKREENVEAEIMGVCEDEARRSYHKSIVVVRPSNEIGDMLATVELVRRWKSEWNQEKQQFVTLEELDEDDEDREGGDEGEDGGDDNQRRFGNNDEDYHGDDGHEKLRARLNQMNSSNNNNNNNNNNNQNEQQQQAQNQSEFESRMQEQNRMNKKTGSNNNNNGNNNNNNGSD